MPTVLERKIKYWERELLDLKRNNKMINYKETKRSTIKLVEPSFNELFRRIVIDEEELTFKRPIDRNSDLRTYSILALLESLSNPIPVNIGDIDTESSILERQKTLKNLRSRARLALDEQGINILYMVAGFVEWREDALNSAEWVKSPLIMVPVTLSIESVHAPFVLKRYEEDIVVNPTLGYFFQERFGITLPTFDLDEQPIENYLMEVEKIVNKKGWKILREISLGLLSFLKINMYKDLQNSKERLLKNPVLRVLSGDTEALGDVHVFSLDFSHDNVPATECFQVINADSSQQDAIHMSREGVSFVMQGPPGTGKSQTITNIIAQGLADGKKILFVSEKMAALQVVYRRLQDVHLADFCLPLHSYKANKREILEEIGKTLDISLQKVKDEAISELYQLDRERQKLNDYAAELHTPIAPLDISVYQAYGFLAELENNSDIMFDLEGVESVTKEGLRVLLYQISDYASAVSKMEKGFESNPWRGSIILSVSYADKERITSGFSGLADLAWSINEIIWLLNEKYAFNQPVKWASLPTSIAILEYAILMQDVPVSWIYEIDLNGLVNEADINSQRLKQYHSTKNSILNVYDNSVLNLDAHYMKKFIKERQAALRELLVVTKPMENDYLKWVELIEMESTRLLAKTTPLATDQDLIRNLTGYGAEMNFTNTESYYALATLLVQNPPITTEWFNEEKYSELKTVAEEAKYRQSVINNIRDELAKGFLNGFFEVNGEACLEKLYQYRDTVIYIARSANIHSSQNEAFSQVTISDADCFLSSTSKIIGNLAAVWKETDKISEGLSIKYHISKLDTVADIDIHLELCKALLKPMFPPQLWSDFDRHDQIIEAISTAQNAYLECADLRKRLLQVCEPEFLAIDSNQILWRFKTEYTNVLKWLKKRYHQDKKTIRGFYKSIVKWSDENAVSLLQDLKRLSELQKWIENNLTQLRNFCGIYFKEDSTDWEEIRENLKRYKDVAKLVQSPETAILILSEATEAHCQYKTYMDLLQRLKTISTLENVIQESLSTIEQMKINIIVSQCERISHDVLAFRHDFNELGLLCKDDSITYGRMVDSLTQLSQLQSLTEWFSQKGKVLITFFPDRYDGIKTCWDKVLSDISCFQDIMSFFPDRVLKDDFIQLLLSRSFANELLGLQAAINMEELQSIQQDLAKLISIEVATPKEVTTQLQHIITNCSSICNIYDSLIGVATSCRTSEELNRDLDSLEYLQEIREEYTLYSDKWGKVYGTWFNGLDTAWDSVSAKIADVQSFKHLIVKYSIPTDFVEIACSYPEAYADFVSLLNYKDDIKHNEETIEWLQTLFSKELDVRNIPLDLLCEKLRACINDFSALEKWIDYRDSRRACCEIGLTSFIGNVENTKAGISDIPQAFKKGFYRKWLDYAMKQSNVISNFRARVQNETIERFCTLDNRHLQISQMRIREKLIKELPNTRRVLSVKDELSTLQKELSKKQRIMPLRKLFRSIPNLLLKLKPCLMMSPLSVSYFLEAETYQFNMVIFDEASQIFPEDAIGAIFRGTQVIIAGDSKQLPPTNFFSANANGLNNDYDLDEEDEINDIISSSILEEADNTLPNCRLLWHYRSRHEHLIAFSNREIYKNTLITFPSSIDRAEDIGVEYSHTPSGVYENRCNVKEAQRCVMLVLKHLQRHPERSLGIITFSEKQQNTIEEYIYRFREKFPQYEWFFDETRDEPFFVKNLENVQGDERDTIIFSICYAKDKNGKMYRRFGPLGNKGGERRLNVAISRAKFNVKLVGSILPSDIDLKRTESEGVRMLRSYIEFAINGAKVLSTPGTDKTMDDDDRFCNTVVEYLQAKGYELARDVGCSDYKVDIAIKHPACPGRFIAGIECDGYTYVMGKTARDRDHLRRKVLQNMGWQMYRIWSTDWIRNPLEAKANLIRFINKAFAQPLTPETFIKPDVEPEKEDLADFVEVPALFESTDVMQSIPVKLQEYYPTNWRRVKYPPGADNDKKIEALLLYVIGIEQPIHRELIYRRLAGAFGNEKATVPIRRTLDPFLNRMQKECLKNDNDFFSLKTLSKIPMRVAGGRPFEYICLQEIASVMIQIVKGTFGISVDELCAETTRLFGFERRGSKIVTAMDEAIKYLIKNGKIKVVDDKVQMMEE